MCIENEGVSVVWRVDEKFEIWFKENCIFRREVVKWKSDEQLQRICDHVRRYTD
jgi:hypothetical protein